MNFNDTRWSRFLHESFESNDQRRCLQSWLCSTLIGARTKDTRILVLHGPPASGKTTILSVIKLLLSQYEFLDAAGYPNAMLLAEKHRYRMLLLDGQSAFHPDASARARTLISGTPADTCHRQWTIASNDVPAFALDNNLLKHIDLLPLQAAPSRDPALSEVLRGELPWIREWAYGARA